MSNTLELKVKDATDIITKVIEENKAKTADKQNTSRLSSRSRGGGRTPAKIET